MVYTGDPDAGGEEDGRWVPRASVPAGPGACVATVRGLSHSELVRCLGTTTAEGALAATEIGVLALAGPGVPASVAEALPLLPLVERIRLGLTILELSQVPTADPT